MSQALSSAGAAFVRLHEGFVAKHYLDPVNVPTIGIGFTWRSNAFRAWWAKNRPGQKFGPGATMTRAEADDALRYLFAEEYGQSVIQFLGKKVAQHVFDAMASVVYNCGAATLGDRWAAQVKVPNYSKAAELLRTTRVTAKGKKLPGLVRRRKEEAHLLERGIYTGVTAPAAPVEPADPMSDGILKRGERGAAVAALIRDLAALGHYDGKLDDVFGYGTEAALLEFQRAHNLKPDGVAGPKTLQAIAGAVAARGEPVEPPKPIPAPSPAPKPEPAPAPTGGLWRAILSIILKLFRRG